MGWRLDEIYSIAIEKGYTAEKLTEEDESELTDISYIARYTHLGGEGTTEATVVIKDLVQNLAWIIPIGDRNIPAELLKEMEQEINPLETLKVVPNPNGEGFALDGVIPCEVYNSRELLSKLFSYMHSEVIRRIIEILDYLDGLDPLP